jgi:hypothetical protein
MKDRLILTISIGENRNFIDLTKDLMASYARKTHSDFIIINDDSPLVKENNELYKTGRNNNIAYILKVKCVHYYLGLYDRVLWLDDTCIVKKNTADLFDITPYNDIKAFNEGSITDFISWKIDKHFIKQKTGYNIKEYNYINSGVVLYTQAIRDFLSNNYIDKHKILFESDYVDQGYLNFIIQFYTIPITYLDSIYNKILIQCQYSSGKCILPEDINANKIKESNDTIFHITGYYTHRYELIKTLCEIVSSPV